MTWFRIDDGFYDHPKIKALPRGPVRKGAIALWTMAGSWCARYLKDGMVPAAQIEELGGSAKDAQALVATTLWHEHDHGCPACPDVPPKHYLYHEWGLYQKTKEQVEKEREQAKKRQANYRAGHGGGSDE